MYIRMPRRNLGNHEKSSDMQDYKTQDRILYTEIILLLPSPYWNMTGMLWVCRSSHGSKYSGHPECVSPEERTKIISFSHFEGWGLWRATQEKSFTRKLIHFTSFLQVPNNLSYLQKRYLKVILSVSKFSGQKIMPGNQISFHRRVSLMREASHSHRQIWISSSDSLPWFQQTWWRKGPMLSSILTGH